MSRMITIKNPYPGFSNGAHRAYEQEESGYFFGRQQSVGLVKMKLRSSKLVSIFSQPKYGKTSFLQAGVVNDLNEHGMFAQGGSKWNICYCRIQGDPLRDLCRALAQPGVMTSEKVRPTLEQDLYQELQKSKYSLRRVLEDCQAVRTNNLLLIFDDFGKALKDDVSDEIKSKFFQQLNVVFKAKHLAIYQLFCLDKIDLEYQLHKDFTPLLDLMQKNKFILPKLSQSELQEAIVKPAHKEGGGIEDEVIAYLLQELTSDEDQLRKLQLYMHRTWFEFLRTRKKGDKINQQHLFRANSLKKKAKVRKKGEPEAVQNSGSSEGDDLHSTYLDLSAALQKKFKEVISILLAYKSTASDKSMTSDQLMKAANVSKTQYNNLRNTFLSLFYAEAGKIDVYEDNIPDQWQDWISEEKERAEAILLLAQMSIDHYIEGNEIKAVVSPDKLSRLAVLKMKPLKKEWAGVYTEQSELALDLWEKISGDVKKPRNQRVKIGSGTTKLKLKSTSAKIKAKAKPDIEEMSEEEAIAKLLAEDSEDTSSAPKKAPRKLVKLGKKDEPPEGGTARKKLTIKQKK